MGVAGHFRYTLRGSTGLLWKYGNLLGFSGDTGRTQVVSMHQHFVINVVRNDWYTRLMSICSLEDWFHAGFWNMAVHSWFFGISISSQTSQHLNYFFQLQYVTSEKVSTSGPCFFAPSIRRTNFQTIDSRQIPSKRHSAKTSEREREKKSRNKNQQRVSYQSPLSLMPRDGCINESGKPLLGAPRRRSQSGPRHTGSRQQTQFHLSPSCFVGPNREAPRTTQQMVRW